MLLRNKDQQALLNIFSSVEEPVEVWAYGSRVDGTAHEGSDLDLVIRGKHLQKVSINILKELKEKIRESNIPIVVELFDWARLPDTFRQNIESRHEVLFNNFHPVMNEPFGEYRQHKGKDDLE